MGGPRLDVAAAVFAAAVCGPLPPGRLLGDDAPPVRLTLKLAIGGEIFGTYLDHSERLIILDYRGVPCAFAFDELEVASAYQAKRRLLIRERGGSDALTAEDRCQLGLYALWRDHPVLAAREFKQAERIDERFTEKIDRARRQFRKRREPQNQADRSAPLDEVPATEIAVLPGLQDTVKQIETGDRQQIIEAYKRFGRSVQERINSDLVLLETEHFLVWTDWERHRRDRLAEWCEGMYRALAVQFGLPAGGNVFLGKCPVFCFRSKARFLRFARTYDDWRPSNAVGYTRTAPSGHVHLVIYRRRATPYEIDRFAGTLVHEGVHAFVHRYRQTLNISGWVGEGLANYMAQKVLTDRCLYGEQADLVARQFVLRGVSIGELLRRPGMPDAHEYPVAHSLVGFLSERDPAAFASFIGRIKEGRSAEDALTGSYGGMDLRGLDSAWRAWVRSQD